MTPGGHWFIPRMCIIYGIYDSCFFSYDIIWKWIECVVVYILSKNNNPRTVQCNGSKNNNEQVRSEENIWDENRFTTQKLCAVGRNQRKAIQCRKISLNFPQFPLTPIAEIFIASQNFRSLFYLFTKYSRVGWNVDRIKVPWENFYRHFPIAEENYFPPDSGKTPMRFDKRRNCLVTSVNTRRDINFRLRSKKKILSKFSKHLQKWNIQKKKKWLQSVKQIQTYDEYSISGPETV